MKVIFLTAMVSLRSLAVGSSIPTRITALPGRRLEDSSTFEYNDLSQFSLRYEKCQYVKTFVDELAEDEDADSPLATKHFVVYRLCPTDYCDTCEDNYGKYVIDVESYLAYTINYQAQAFEDMCNSCSESGCGKLCYQSANLEASGYIDASQFYYCQQLAYGDDDDDGNQLYIGPSCESNGQKIMIGLFWDENCWEPRTDLDIEQVLGAKLSYYLLSHASTDDGSVCLSCQANGDDQDNENDQADADDVNEMCEDLYNSAAKCESKTGLEGGFIQVNREEKDYENQVENEFMACTFIDSLIWNSYTETGEIDIYSPQDEIIRQVTPLQSLTLSILSLSIVALFGSAFYIHRRIESQVSFIRQRGAQLI